MSVKTDPDRLTRDLAIALEVAVAAGAILLEGQGRRHHADSKRIANDLVTEFDTRSEAAIVSALVRAFPSDTILGEEGGLVTGAGTSGTSRRWLVDPLDGTVNFAHGLPFYCVSIGLEEAGVLRCGVVHAPSLGYTFAAARGQGATMNGAPIAVSDESELSRALLATGFPYDRAISDDNNFEQFIALQRRAQAVRRVGSAALDLAFVARGAFEGYWEMKLKPWDLAAGALLVEEAGGRVSGWSGEPLDVDHGACVATNGRIHDQLVAALVATGIPAAARPQ